MRGFVPTPPAVVDLMVAKLFAERAPDARSRVLDPGCGAGEFIAGVLRACRSNRWPVPRIVGIEMDPARAAAARRKFRGIRQIEIRRADFLRESRERFDFIVGNPPYVSILGLSENERMVYRAVYRTARGRFDLYGLFFEQALGMLARDGRVVCITPEKFLYVETARPLRELLRTYRVRELHFVAEGTFANRVAYPIITTVDASPRRGNTRIVRRDGSRGRATLDTSESWLAAVEGFVARESGVTLGDVSRRISCGVATGADAVFVLPTADVPDEVRRFSYPTVSGRQITPSRELRLQSSLLAPYDDAGTLLPESRLGALGRFLRDPARMGRLQGRTCVERKPWYAFHDSLPLGDMLRPKLLCKDISESPFFVVDHGGGLVPRHSVYYIVPSDRNDLSPLADYLNSDESRAWLTAHCQRAANGFLRLQSHVLRRLPVPAEFARSTADTPVAPP